MGTSGSGPGAAYSFLTLLFSAAASCSTDPCERLSLPWHATGVTTTDASACLFCKDYPDIQEAIYKLWKFHFHFQGDANSALNAVCVL